MNSPETSSPCRNRAGWTPKASGRKRRRNRFAAARPSRRAAPLSETPQRHRREAEPVPEAAQKGIDKVNRGEARIEGKTPGKRRADLQDGHEIAEVVEAGGVIACEYHSPGGPRIPCPTGLGSGPSGAAQRSTSRAHR